MARCRGKLRKPGTELSAGLRTTDSGHSAAELLISIHSSLHRGYNFHSSSKCPCDTFVARPRSAMDGLSARVQEFMDGLSARDRVELRELHQGRDRSQFTARLKELGFTKLGQRIKVEQALDAEEAAPAPEPEPLLAEPPIVEPEPAEPESQETAWRSAAAEGRRLAEVARQQQSERETAAAASEREAEAARTAARLEQRRRRGTALADRIEEIAPPAAAAAPMPAPTLMARGRTGRWIRQ